MSSKKVFRFGLVLMLVLGLLAGCTPKPPVVVDPDPPAPQPVDKDAVLLAAATDFLTSIPDNNNNISAKDALQIMEDNPGQVMYLDIRAQADYEEGHVKGAVNIPLADLGKNLDRLPKNKQIIIQCYSGQTSSLATALTRVLGFNSINFAGGFNFGWKPLELDASTLETETNPLPDAATPTLSEEEQILWDAVAQFFNDGKTYIEKPEAVLDLIQDNPGSVYVLDIRAEADYAKGHIETAENIPFKQVGANIGQLPTNKPIYVTCYTGQTAAQTIAVLRIAGFNAFSVNRGMTGWNGAELPVVE